MRQEEVSEVSKGHGGVRGSWSPVPALGSVSTGMGVVFGHVGTTVSIPIRLERNGFSSLESLCRENTPMKYAFVLLEKIAHIY